MLSFSHKAVWLASRAIALFVGVIGVSTQIYGQQVWPTPPITERWVCPESNQFEGRALWIDHDAVILDVPDNALCTYYVQGSNSARIIRDHSGSCPSSNFLPTPLVRLGSLDYDAAAQTLWAGGYGDNYLYYRYVAGQWSEAFASNFSFPRIANDAAWPSPANSDGLAIDNTDGTLWLSSDAGFNVHHVTQGGTRMSDSSFIVPFPNSGIETRNGILLLADIRRQRVYAYSKIGRYPYGYFSTNNTEFTGTEALRQLEDLDLREEPGGHILLTGITANSTTAPDDQQRPLFTQYEVTNVVTDSDSDGVPDIADNCASVVNTAQTDSNGDGIGDECQQTDNDDDDVLDALDNCPNAYNPAQTDVDRDGLGDACDPNSSCLSVEANLQVEENVADIELVDLDGDGDDDLVTLHRKVYPGGSDIGTISIRWSGSHGSIGPLSEPVEYAVGEGPVAMAVGYFNDDSFKDIAVAFDADGTVSPSIPASVRILFGDANHHFGTLSQVALPNPVPVSTPSPKDIVAMNLDDTTAADELVIVAVRTPTNQAYLVREQLPATNPPTLLASTLFDINYSPKKAIAARMNLDGFDDLVVLDAITSIAIHVHYRTLSTPPYLQTTPVNATNPGWPQGLDLAAVKLRTAGTIAPVDIAVLGFKDSQVYYFENDVLSSTFTAGTPQVVTDGTNSPLAWAMARVPAALCPNCPSCTSPCNEKLDGLAFVVEQADIDAPNERRRRLSVFPAANASIAAIDLSSRKDMAISWSGTTETPAMLTSGNLDSDAGQNVDVMYVDKPGSTSSTNIAALRNVVTPGIGSFVRSAVKEPKLVAVADVDGQDGPDLLVADRLPSSGSVGNVTVFRQSSGTPNRFPYDPQEIYESADPLVNNETWAAVTGKMDGDNLADMVVAYTLSSNGYGYFRAFTRNATCNCFQGRPPVELRKPTGPGAVGKVWVLTLADVDLDGHLDAVAIVASSMSGAINVFVARGDGAGGFAAETSPGYVLPITSVSGFVGPNAMTLRDLNCDGKPELITAQYNANNVFVFPNNSTPGNVIFGSASNSTFNLPLSGSQPVSVECGVFPGATGPFIAVANSTSSPFSIAVFPKSTSGGLSFLAPTTYALAAQPTWLDVADLDSDGDDDIVVASAGGRSVDILNNNGDGTFARLTPSIRVSGSSVPGGPRTVKAAQLDGQGGLELITTGGALNGSLDDFLQVNSSQCGGVPGCLKGDVNNDGMVDGRDIQPFVDTLLSPMSANGRQRCAADMNSLNSVEMADLPLFICKLLGDEACSGCPMSSFEEGSPPWLDCNGNGVLDSQDISSGTSHDCNGNGEPDECEIECNGNGVPDDCDVNPADPDGDGIVYPDCNGDLLPDSCDIAYGPPFGSLDCNENGVPDECDIATGTSQDENENGIPDECEGEQMMGDSQMMQTFGEGAGETLEPPDKDAAWEMFYEWCGLQCWGPGCETTGAEQTHRMLEKLRDLGLPEVYPPNGG